MPILHSVENKALLALFKRNGRWKAEAFHTKDWSIQGKKKYPIYRSFRRLSTSYTQCFPKITLLYAQLQSCQTFQCKTALKFFKKVTQNRSLWRKKDTWKLWRCILARSLENTAYTTICVKTNGFFQVIKNA